MAGTLPNTNSSIRLVPAEPDSTNPSALSPPPSPKSLLVPSSKLTTVPVFALLPPSASNSQSANSSSGSPDPSTLLNTSPAPSSSAADEEAATDTSLSPPPPYHHRRRARETTSSWESIKNGFHTSYVLYAAVKGSSTRGKGTQDTRELDVSEANRLSEYEIYRAKKAKEAQRRLWKMRAAETFIVTWMLLAFCAAIACQYGLKRRCHQHPDIAPKGVKPLACQKSAGDALSIARVDRWLTWVVLTLYLVL